MTNLADFNWQESGADDFFGVKEEGIESTPIAQEETQEEEESIEEEEETKKNPPKSKDKTEPEEELSFFEEEEINEGEDTTPKTISSEKTFWNDAFEDFKANGVFRHIELGEDQELDKDTFFELQQQEYDKEMELRLKSWADELDEDGKAFLNFKIKGGNTEEFFQVYSNSSEVPTGDLEDDSYQDAVIRYRLKQEGWDEEEIKDRLDYYTETGKKKTIATKYDVKNQEAIAKQKEAVLESQENHKKALKEQEENFKSSMKEALSNTEKIGDFNIKEERKDVLLNFMTRKSYRVDDKKSITGFQKKLGEVLNDPEKTILLASLLESDFDVSDISKKAKTRQTNKIKSKMEQRKGVGGSGSSSKATLADLIS